MATISGFVRDREGNLAANVKVRAYKRSNGDQLGEAITGDGITSFVAPDPYYDNVYLNIDMSGVNDSNVFKDLSSYKNTITTHGDTKLKTNTGLFTGPAIYLDGSGDYLSTAAPTINGDFTLEADLYFTTISSYAILLCCRTWGVNNDYLFGIANNNQLVVTTLSLGPSWTTIIDTLAINTLHKLAIVRKDGVFSFYINGNKNSVTYTDNRVLTPANPILRLFSAIDPIYWQGYVKFFRITKYARYTESYNIANINYSNGSGSKGGPLGYYRFDTNYAGEVDLICLDIDDSYFMQDLCKRTKAE